MKENLRKILFTALFLAAFGVLFHVPLEHIISSWASVEGSYGPLILAVSLYLVWKKRKHLRKLPKRPALLPGALLAGIGCFMLFAGHLSSTMLLQQIAILPTLLGTIALFWGWAHLNVLLVPVAYLFFLTGLVETMLGSMSIHLRNITAWIAAELLALIGMPVFLTATVIQLPHISLDVVRECSGINHITALMALSVPLAFIRQLPPIRKVLLVLGALLIGILANGLRVALIGIYTRYYPDGPLHGPYETLYVSFIFFFGMVLLIGLSRLLSGKDQAVSADRTEAADSPPSAEESSPVTAVMLQNDTPITGKRIAAFAVAGILFVINLGAIHLYTLAPVPLKRPLEAIPTSISGFTGMPLDRIHEQIRPFPADRELLRVYRDTSGKRIDLYIGYFEKQEENKEFINYQRDWMHEDAHEVSLGRASEPMVIKKTTLQDRRQPPSDVYFWYLMDGKIVTNRYAGKFLTFWSGLVKRKNNAAVVILRTDSPEEAVMPFLKELAAIVENEIPFK
mgnify:CR=1 FL=1